MKNETDIRKNLKLLGELVKKKNPQYLIQTMICLIPKHMSIRISSSDPTISGNKFLKVTLSGGRNMIQVVSNGSLSVGKRARSYPHDPKRTGLTMVNYVKQELTLHTAQAMGFLG